MIKPFYIFLFILCFCCETKSQTPIEYITNGSFEQIDSCYGQPAGIGFDVFAWSGCTGWSNPIKSSSDLWCENPKIGNQTPPFIPGIGYQIPRTGNNMAGLLVGGASIYNYREYIQNQLAYQLQNNKQYNLTFYIAFNNLDCISTQFGIKFYNQKLNGISKLWLTDIIPDAVNNVTEIVYDTLNWQKVTISFIANGNEQYAVIGNFEDSTKLSYTLPCDTSFWGNLHLGGGYFFIDDVSMVEAPIKDPIIPNVFTPNKDNVNDVWVCNFIKHSNDVVHCTIYNRWGLKVFETQNSYIEWDGTTTSGIVCNESTYFYVIETKEKLFKGFIQLIR